MVTSSHIVAPARGDDRQRQGQSAKKFLSPYRSFWNPSVGPYGPAFSAWL